MSFAKPCISEECCSVKRGQKHRDKENYGDYGEHAVGEGMRLRGKGKIYHELPWSLTTF